MLMVIFACKDWCMENTISKKQKAPKGYVIDPTKREFFVKNSGTINEDGTITSGTVVKLEVKTMKNQ